ncbi:MAG TPA: glycosyltransferase family 4 protein [Kiritimatiellia bacterium]|nr:glycosyltransferase family 4 protein [Kiritimatiellia bacterium]
MAGIKNWKSSKFITPQRMGFISTRFAGTDGVSLESAKWAHVLEEDEHKCFWYAGRLDHDPAVSMCIPEAFFSHPENVWINERIWGRTARERVVTDRIHAMAAYLKSTIYDFVKKFDIKILIFENVLSIPMHVPLGVAITEFIAETHLPGIAHHHDFYWERTRYSVNAVNDFLDMAFPSRDHDLQHVVINENAQEELARRKAVPSILIPNVLDFETPPPSMDTYASDVLAEIGLAPGDVMILQPTRVVPRKGIEHAINLLKLLGDPKYKLVITHEAGDEGLEYRNMLAEYARQSHVDLRFVETRVGDVRQINSEGRKVYTLWDIYPHAAMVTYPSLYEGFGNAFLEAVYFKVPVLVNRYAIFHRDIEPKGFQVPVMDGFLTSEVVAQVKRMLEDQTYRKQAVDQNYRIALRHYSYSELRRRLRMLMTNVGSLYPS